jgi:hypothetical protein
MKHSRINSHRRLEIDRGGVSSKRSYVMPGSFHKMECIPRYFEDAGFAIFKLAGCDSAKSEI